MRISHLLPFILVLSPLLYSLDGDPYRAYEVAAVALAYGALALLVPLRPAWLAEWGILLGYAAVLVLQQFFSPWGNLWFGFQYAAVMCAAFVPAGLVRLAQWSPADFSVWWDRAMLLLAGIIFLNFTASAVLGVGETYTGFRGTRAFGYLGDSITPVIVFPLLYFFLRKRYLWVLAMLASLVIAGGAAAIIMLAIALGLFLLAGYPMSYRVALLAGMALVATVGLPFLQSVVNVSGLDYSWNTRLLSYEIGWGLFLENPVLGVGINQSMRDAATGADSLAALWGISNYFLVTQVHNAFLRTLAETGIVGLGLLLSLCALLIARGLKAVETASNVSDPRARALVVAGSIWAVSFIVGYQTVGWFEHGHPQFAWLLLISSVSFTASQVCSVRKRQAPAKDVEAPAIVPQLLHAER